MGLGAHPWYIVVGAQAWVGLAEEGVPGEHGKDREVELGSTRQVTAGRF